MKKLAIALFMLCATMSWGQNYIGAMGLLFQPDGTLVTTSSPTPPNNLNSFGFLVDSTGALIVSNTGSGTTFPLSATNGTQAAPSYSFGGGTGGAGTGMYSTGANTIDFTVGNSHALQIGGSIQMFKAQLIWRVVGGLIGETSNGTIGWSSSTDNVGTNDTAISRCNAADICVGNGTAGDKTGILEAINVPATWTYWSSPAGNTAAVAGVPFTQNVASAWGIIIDKRVTGATKLRYNVGTADNTANLYNLALYDSGGNKITECGATAGTTFAPSGGIKACTVSSFAVAPGLYFEVVTTNCASACAGLNGTTALWVYASAANVGATTNAVLPGSITPPAASYTQVNTAPSIQLN
jgi:hypothetical protein